MNTYIIASNKEWDRRISEEADFGLGKMWLFVDNTFLLNTQIVATDPHYIFFLHWSEKVPADIIAKYECVCFHMTDLPFGRGGTPLQNLIARGIRQTKVTAFRMTNEIDAGPIYLQRDLSLEGLAEEIYIRASRLAIEMMLEIAETEPVPVPQVGEPMMAPDALALGSEANFVGAVKFKRRTPLESEIGSNHSLLGLFDFLRMLDADTYPRAFLVHGGFRYTFSRPALRDGRIVADVEIRRQDNEREPG